MQLQQLQNKSMYNWTTVQDCMESMEMETGGQDPNAN